MGRGGRGEGSESAQTDGKASYRESPDESGSQGARVGAIIALATVGVMAILAAQPAPDTVVGPWLSSAARGELDCSLVNATTSICPVVRLSCQVLLLCVQTHLMASLAAMLGMHHQRQYQQLYALPGGV